MPCFAEERIDSNGRLVRYHTRIYAITPSSLTDRDVHECFGSVYLYNPGSAKGSSTWGPLTLGTDQTLTTIERIFNKAISKTGRTYPDGYLQILNLCHYVSGNKVKAEVDFASHGATQLESIHPNSRFIWVAWAQRLNLQGPLCQAIRDIETSKKPAFCFDGRRKIVCPWDSSVCFPAHPVTAIYLRTKMPNYENDVACQMAKFL